MKTFRGKNILIGFLSVTTVVPVVIIVMNWPQLAAIYFPKEKPKPAAKAAKRANPILEYRKGVVSEAIAAKSEALQKCYERYLGSEPSIVNGTVRVNWNITKSGAVSEASITESEFTDSGLKDCVLNEVQVWKFPPPPQDEPYTVAHRFTFKHRAPSNIEFE